MYFKIKVWFIILSEVSGKWTVRYPRVIATNLSNQSSLSSQTLIWDKLCVFVFAERSHIVLDP